MPLEAMIYLTQLRVFHPPILYKIKQIETDQVIMLTYTGGKLEFRICGRW